MLLTEEPTEVTSETTVATDGDHRSDLLYAAGLSVWAILVYLLTSRGVPQTILGWLGIDRGHLILWQLSHALFWASLLVAARYVSHRIPSLPRPSRLLIGFAVLAGLFQIATFALAGLALGIGESPYSHDPLPMAANLIYVSAMLVAIEWTRACLVSIISVRNTTLALVFSATLLAFITLPLARLGSPDDIDSLLSLTGGHVLPAFSEGLLASFLVLIGGPLASIAYRGVLVATEWLSPILPSLDWPVIAFIGTMAPMVGLWIIRQAVVDEPGHRETSDSSEAVAEQRRGRLGWLSVAVIGVTITWFVTGMFGVRPVVVSGPSMNPALEVGDVVILREVPTSEVDVGDIVQIHIRGIPVIHRVVDINNDGPQIVFVTRGDNNNVDDDPVLESGVNGKVVLVVPKAGWPSVWLRNLIGGLR